MWRADVAYSHGVRKTVILHIAAAYDRGEKQFATYRRIASMRDYVLIDPDLKRIELFRHAEHGIWELHASLEIEVSWDRMFGNVD